MTLLQDAIYYFDFGIKFSEHLTKSGNSFPKSLFVQVKNNDILKTIICDECNNIYYLSEDNRYIYHNNGDKIFGIKILDNTIEIKSIFDEKNIERKLHVKLDSPKVLDAKIFESLIDIKSLQKNIEDILEIEYSDQGNIVINLKKDAKIISNDESVRNIHILNNISIIKDDFGQNGIKINSDNSVKDLNNNTISLSNSEDSFKLTLQDAARLSNLTKDINEKFIGQDTDSSNIQSNELLQFQQSVNIDEHDKINAIKATKKYSLDTTLSPKVNTTIPDEYNSDLFVDNTEYKSHTCSKIEIKSYSEGKLGDPSVFDDL